MDRHGIPSFPRYPEVYTALSQERFIFVTEEVTKELASSLCAMLIYFNGVDTERDITLFIHTVGGDALALSSIYDVMSLIEAPICTVGMGRVYSAGSFILAAGTKGKRHMFKNAEVLIHGLQCAYPEVPLSDQTDSKIYYNYLDSLNKKMLSFLSKHTGQTVTKLTQDSKRDLYLDAKGALKYGLIDSIL